MMGQKDRSLAALPPVTLDAFVPPDHCYRHLERTLDLACVRDLVRDAGADSGRPSIDPVVLFKRQPILCFEGLRSERQLMQVVADRLSLRWYLGYDLTESLPDHSSLTRIRERYGLAVFRRFFEAVVEQCLAAGLVWGQELYIDATKVAANAALDSLRPRFAVEAHLGRLFTETGDEREGDDGSGGTAEPGSDPPARLPMELTGETRSELAERAVQRHDWLGRAGRPDRATTSGLSRRTADFRLSTTDPAATPMPYGERGTQLGYQDHDLVDGGRARIILTALVTPADVMENVPLRDLLWRVCFRRMIWPHHVTGDTTYSTVEDIVALEDAGIRAFFPLPDFDGRTPFFGKGTFTYDATRDEHRCPQGQPLPRRKTKYTEQEVVYRADPATCNACPVKTACTASAHGRMIHRSFYADYLEKVRRYHATEAYQQAMRKRQVWVEPLLAEAKAWHGLRRLRLRGLVNANIQGLLVAAGQNLKRFVAVTGWGRRHAPCGSLLALPGASGQLVGSFG